MKSLFCILCIIGGVGVFAIDMQNVKHLHLNKVVPLPFQRRSMNNPEGRITNGQVTTPKQIKYQVALFVQFNGGTGFCGAILVGGKCAVTAAHCVNGLKDNVVLVFGAWNISDPNEVGRKILVEPKTSVTVHPGWDEQQILNDIAVIRLSENVTNNDNIEPVLLPAATSSFTGEEAIVSGFGKISDSATTITDVLRYVKVPIISNLQCNIPYLGRIKSGHICASGSGGRSACNGDSGGPLVWAEDKKTLIGIVSFGSSFGCSSGFPSVYTRVTSYLEFIATNCAN